MNKWQRKLQEFFQGRNGLDELGKFLLIASLIVYIIGCFLQSGYIISLGWVGMIYVLYRVFSKQVMNRREENLVYTRYVKLWKLRYESRKESKIFMCKSCGRYVRVPKGKGKVSVTCPVCGNKTVHRT